MKKLLTIWLAASCLVAVAVPAAALAEETVVTAQVAQAATVTALSITSGNPGTPTVAITVTGTFDTLADPAPTVVVTGTGVTPGTPTVITATTISVEFTIDSSATAGNRLVTVNQGGQTGTVGVNFLVNTVTTLSDFADFSLGYLTSGQTVTGTKTLTNLVQSNSTTWGVLVKGSNTGYLLKNGTDKLTPGAGVFKIGNSVVSLQDSNDGFTFHDTDGKSPVIHWSQDVPSEAISGEYSITLTFSVSTP